MEELIIREISEDDPFGGLMTAIIINSVKDLKSLAERNGLFSKKEAMRFINNKWFEQFCHYLNTDPQYIRKNLNLENK